jgi:hypothetical protein
MTLQQLDTLIAFGAVMLAASLVITAGTQLVISLLGLRGANLRRSLVDLFETASQDRDAKRYAKEIARRVLRHPLISGSVFSRFCIRLDELPFLPADAAGKLRWVGSGIPLQPWLLSALGGCFILPLTLVIIKRLSSLDFCAYSGIVTSHVPVLNLCDHPWRSGAILGAVFGGVLSRWRLATSIRLDELVAVLEKLSAPAGGTLPDPAQRAMLVIAGETRSRPRLKMSPVSAQIDRIFQDTLDDNDGGVAVAVEKAVTQISGHTEPRLEGLNLWFDHAMDRASQRFTLQARVITVVLSLVLVFVAHLDAIRLFQMLSSDAQVRAQLAGSADAIIKQAEQLPRARDGAGLQATREIARSVVPDVYRKAMVAVLEPTPATTEQPKPKSRHASRSSAAPPPGGSQSRSSGGPAVPNNIQIVTSASQIVGEDGQALPLTAKALTEAPVRERENRAATPAKPKSPTKEREKPGAAPREDKATIEAKAKAAKVLEARPGFASREDAVFWLRATLDGDPALENLVAAYGQEVDIELVGDADKLIDHSASIKRELARTEFQLFPEKWSGWKPNEHELPGLLIAGVFLCLGAPFCYTMLRVIASLRPLPSLKHENRTAK